MRHDPIVMGGGAGETLAQPDDATGLEPSVLPS